MLGTVRRPLSPSGHFGDPRPQSTEVGLRRSTLTPSFLTAALLSAVFLSGFIDLVPMPVAGSARRDCA
jgi:hypothetical protein